ncbi:MAG TPA: hypothetical protein VII24_08280 [Pseudolabrys sp.]|jgi:hypothetical protein
MAYTSSALAPRVFAFTSAADAELPMRTQRSLFDWLLDTMMVSRMHDAERDVARYLADTGGKFTDESEREIERRFLSTPSRW